MAAKLLKLILIVALIGFAIYAEARVPYSPGSNIEDAVR